MISSAGTRTPLCATRRAPGCRRGVGGLGVTTIHPLVGKLQIQAWEVTAPFVREIDILQYEVRGRTGGSAEDAFDRLRRISQSENVTLAVIAQRVLDETVRRAQARHSHT